MKHQLEFSLVYSYGSTVEGISLPVTLTSGRESVDLLAKVDTGASNCLFERTLAAPLKLNVESGYPSTFLTATGQFKAFGHEVSIGVFDLKFDSMVYFFAHEHIKKNLLGRTGWLDRVRVGLIEYDREIYLAPYDFEPR